MPKFVDWFFGLPQKSAPLPKTFENIAKDPRVAMAISHVQGQEHMAPRRYARANMLNESRGNAPSIERRLKPGFQRKESLRSYSGGMYGLASNLVTLWVDAVNDRRSYIAQADEMSRYYIVDTILETITEDVLNPDGNGGICEYVSDNETIKLELDLLTKRLNLENSVMEFCQNFINLGEFTLRIEKGEYEQDGEKVCGVIGLPDDLNQVGILSFYERGEPVNFLVFEESEYKLWPANECAHFVLGNRTMRIKLDDAINPDYQIDRDRIPPEMEAKLPDYVRVGKPFFHALTGKLRQLQVLEDICVALKLNQITQSKLFGVKVGAGMPPDQVQQLMRDFEEIANSQMGVDIEDGQLTIAEMITMTGRYKALPDYADGKGGITNIDIRQDSNLDDILNKIENLRQIILSSCGIPYSLVFGSETSDGGEKSGSQAGEIRRFGRYIRKLSKIQRSLSKGLKHIAAVHLAARGIDFTMDAFDVKWKYQMIDVSGLEKMEFDHAKIGYISENLDLLKNAAEIPMIAQRFKEAGICEWIGNLFDDLTGGIEIFDHEKDAEEDEDMDTELRNNFITAASDHFVALQKARGIDIEPDADAVMLSSKVREFMQVTKANFAKRMERRAAANRPKGDGSPHHNMIASARDRFSANRVSKDVL